MSGGTRYGAAVTVVIPNWNGEGLLPTCIDALMDQSVAPDEILVVDNGSTDGSVQLLADQYPEVRVARLSENAGFAAAVNMGIRSSSGDLIALLNNDAIPEAEWLAILCRAIEDDDSLGGVAPLVVRGRGSAVDGVRRIESAGDYLTVWGTAYQRGRGSVEAELGFESREVFYVAGTACLLRRSMIEDVGGFDATYFAYFEDVDLCFRARLRGWRFRLVPEAVAAHLGGETSGGSKSSQVKYLVARNSVVTFAKNMPSRLLLRQLPFFALGLIARLIGAIASGGAGATARGMIAGFGRALKMSSVRKEVQASASIPPSEIDDLILRRFPHLSRKYRHF